MLSSWLNLLLETNRRAVSPLSAGQEFRRAVHAWVFIFCGGGSANR